MIDYACPLTRMSNFAGVAELDVLGECHMWSVVSRFHIDTVLIVIFDKSKEGSFNI